MGSELFNIARFPVHEILQLLNKNVIGTPGQGMLYQHLKVNEKIFKISEPYFVNLIKKDHILGTCCFCHRKTINNSREIDSFYIRYFSFKEGFRQKVPSKRYIKRNGTIKTGMEKILQGRGLNKSAKDKFYHYAYVDPRNLRSSKLCGEFGFEEVRKFSTIIFNRIRPQDYPQVTPVSHDQLSNVAVLLKDFYKDYNMFSMENLFGDRHYYIVKDHEGRIVAGTQVNPDHWKIIALPGLLGKVILNTFSTIPYLKRLFNKDYRFLTFEGIYYATGCESYLQILFESLLARYRVNSAMIWIDTETPLYKTIKSLKLGLVSKLNKEVRAQVICRFFNFSAEEKKLFKSGPAYISGIDLT
jgi:hypothetical protein